METIKQKQINVYHFNELSEEVQNKVHGQNRYFLTESRTCNFDELTEEFKDFIEFIGGRFTDDFVGYDTLGNRVVTEWKGDLNELLNKIEDNEIKDDCNYLCGEKLPELKIDKRLLDIMQSDFDYSEYEVVGGEVVFNVWHTDKADELTKKYKKDRAKLYDWMYEVLNIINNRFLDNIRAEQEYLESKEAFAEYCELNEKLFTAEGVQVN